ESDRAVLVDHLQASLSSKKISYLDEHVTEAKDRLAAYRSGKTRSFDGASFVASLRNSLS
ncbi:addiction module protein, partial [Rubritalea spongiae]